MAWYPSGVRKNIAPGSNDPAIEVIGAILHVAVSEGKSLYDYFAHRSGGIESHFYIRRDGTVEQYRSTGFEADANLKANSFWEDGVRKGFVSIETQGMGPGEWTPEQMESIKRLLSWLSERHNFPLRTTPGPFTPGVGYHTLHGSPSAWTPVAKSCPGADRKRQYHNELEPWMESGGTGMSWNEQITNFQNQGGHSRQAWDWLMRTFNNARRADRNSREARNRLRRMEPKVDVIAEKVDGLTANMEDEVREAVEAALDARLEVVFRESDGSHKAGE